MNKQEIETKIEAEITKICETNKQRYGRQYPVTKWARVQLQELGLWEMFSKISRSYKGDPGQSDAQDVLAEVEERAEAAGIDDVVITGGSIGRLLNQLHEIEKSESEPTADEILNDVENAVNYRMNPDFLDLEYGLIRDNNVIDVENDEYDTESIHREFAELKASIKRGNEYIEQGYSIQPEYSRTVYGIETTIRESAIASKRKWAGYLAGQPSYRMIYLMKKSATDDVMTSSEIESEFNLSQSTVAQAIHRGQIPARKSGGTWLIARKDAVERWGRRK